MKIAIAYDWLNIKSGGGEATLEQILKIYPSADLHCLVYNSKKFSNITRGHKVVTSRLQKFPGFMKKNPNLLLPFISGAVDAMSFEGYDLVISVSSAWVKNITVPKNTKHICYCFSPARMIWDSWPEYLDSQKIGPFKIGPISKFFITKKVSKIRLWDYYHSDGVDEFVAISKYIGKRIKKYYGQDSQLVYPPVDTVATKEKGAKDYYLVLSVLSQYKNIDLAIDAFSKNGHKLIIAGDGPDAARLANLAKDFKNISLVGRVDDEEKWQLLAGAKALVFVSIEDFGITPVEALSVGTPVVALNGGGLTETINSKNGVFFDKPTAESLDGAIKKLEKTSFDIHKIVLSAQSFSTSSFAKNFSEVVDETLKGSPNAK
jgi:glycosyltransferase involved in cell wall biosynthesis